MKIISRHKLRIAVGAALLCVVSCSRAPQQIDSRAYTKEIEQWRAQRLASLTNESGWLTLVGLFWLKDGKNTFGSDASNEIVVPQVAKDIRIPKATTHLGAFVLNNGVVTFETRRRI